MNIEPERNQQTEVNLAKNRIRRPLLDTPTLLHGSYFQNLENILSYGSICPCCRLEPGSKTGVGLTEGSQKGGGKDVLWYGMHPGLHTSEPPAERPLIGSPTSLRNRNVPGANDFTFKNWAINQAPSLGHSMIPIKDLGRVDCADSVSVTMTLGGNPSDELRAELVGDQILIPPLFKVHFRNNTKLNQLYEQLHIEGDRHLPNQKGLPGSPTFYETRDCTGWMREKGYFYLDDTLREELRAGLEGAAQTGFFQELVRITPREFIEKAISEECLALPDDHRLWATSPYIHYVGFDFIFAIPPQAFADAFCEEYAEVHGVELPRDLELLRDYFANDDEQQWGAKALISVKKPPQDDRNRSWHSRRPGHFLTFEDLVDMKFDTRYDSGFFSNLIIPLSQVSHVLITPKPNLELFTYKQESFLDPDADEQECADFVRATAFKVGREDFAEVPIYSFSGELL